MSNLCILLLTIKMKHSTCSNLLTWKSKLMSLIQNYFSNSTHRFIRNFFHGCKDFLDIKICLNLFTMKKDLLICHIIFLFWMIFQRNLISMKLIIQMKILDRCSSIVKYWKISTRACLMNGMNKLDFKNQVNPFVKNMIFNEQDKILLN